MSVSEQNSPGVSAAVNGHVPGEAIAFEANADCRVRSDLIDKEISSRMATARTVVNDFSSASIREVDSSLAGHFFPNYSDGFFNDDGFKASKPLFMEVLSICEP